MELLSKLKLMLRLKLNSCLNLKLKLKLLLKLSFLVYFPFFFNLFFLFFLLFFFYLLRLRRHHRRRFILILQAPRQFLYCKKVHKWHVCSRNVNRQYILTMIYSTLACVKNVILKYTSCRAILSSV